MKRKALSLAMALCLVFSLFSWCCQISATEEKDTTRNYTVKDIISGAAAVDEVYGTLEAKSVPEIVGYERAVAKNHIKRLYDDEKDNLNKIVFLNADGSTTEYLFAYPVKYLADGKIQDITLDISKNELSESFESSANSSKTVFPYNLADGISLTGNNQTISLVPYINQTEIINATLIDHKKVIYKFDDTTEYEYSLTYTGFKENIIVSEYTGQTEFLFYLYTNGLKLTEQDGSFSLKNKENEICAVIGDVIIFSADEKNNSMGRLEASQIIENEQYVLRIIVDQNYLMDENTAYPIRIDPTIEICYNNNGSSAIEDVTINSLSGTDGSSGSLRVGLRDTYGVSRILMKFPGLNLSSLGTNYSITNATVEVRDVMCESASMTVYCYVFSGNEWSESTANWSNVNPNNISTYLSSNVFSYSNGLQQSTPHWYSFDITEAVKGWKSEYYNINKGIIFKAPSSVENGNTYINKTIASYNRSSYKPTLTVTYGSDSHYIPDDTYYVNNKNSGKYLKYTSSSTTASSGLISSLGDSIRWEIRAVDNGYIIREKSNPTYYLSVPTSSSSSSLSIVSVADASIPERCIWDISLASGSGCLIKNKYNSRYLYYSGNSVATSLTLGTTGTETYFSRVWRLASTSSYGNTSMYEDRELMNGFLISCCNADVGETINQSIAKNPTNALWANKSDFVYTTNYASLLSIDGDEISAISSGYASISATHKVTGLTQSFSLTIFPGTFDVYIMASGVSFDNFINGSFAGHGWIEIISNSAHEYTIGHYSLPSSETVTIGRWGSQINQNDGNFVGIWYNREVYEINVNGKYGSKTYSYLTVNKNKLNQITSLITSTYSGYNLITNNCVTFAIEVWNICADTNNTIDTSIFTPNGLVNAIEDLTYHYSGNLTRIPETIMCGFYNGINYVEHIVPNSIS